MRTLNFRSTPRFQERYRQLLRTEWSRSTVADTVSLLEDQLGDAGLRISFGSTEEQDDGPKLYQIPASAPDELREYLERLNYDLVLQHEQRLQTRLKTPADRKLARDATAAAFLLSFPLWPAFPQSPQGELELRLQGDLGLFDDTRSILYLATIHELMPSLKDEKWRPHYNLLLQSLFTHATTAWKSNPAHQHFLLSEFYDLWGDTEMAAQELFYTFQNTEASDHEYFTVAYGYWSYLIEHGDLQRATLFALDFHRQTPMQWLPKARELVSESFEYLLGARKAG